MNSSGSAARSSIRFRLAAPVLLATVLVGCNSLQAGPANARPPARFSLTQYRPEAARREGGSVVIGDWESPTDFSPLFNDEVPSREINSLLFAGLTRIDAQLQPFADLLTQVPTLDSRAVTWDRVAKRMTVNYQLRSGLQWSDGQPLTADDVAFTLNVIRDSPPGSALNSDGYSTIQNLQVQDPLHFTITFNRIYPQFADLFSAVLPRHRLGTIPTARVAQDAYFGSPDVVSGPYRISELVPDDHVVLVRNEAWGRGRAGRRPHLDSILFRIYPEVGQLIDAARRAQVDLALEIPGDQLGSAESPGGMSQHRQPSLAYEQVTFNQADPNPLTGGSPPWKGDAALLQALRTSIDRSGLLKRVFHGGMPLAQSPISSLSLFHDADAALRFDPSAAAQALDRDGWITAGDGVRVKNGRRLSFSLLTAVGDPLRTAVRADLIAQWRKIGVEVRAQDAHPSDMFSGYVEGGLLEQGRFEAGLWTWRTGADPDGIYPLQHSSQIPSDSNQGQGSNFGRFANPEIDRALDRGRETLLTGERVQAYAAFERAYVRLGAELPLFEPVEAVLSSARLHNLEANPGPSSTLWNAADWWID